LMAMIDLLSLLLTENLRIVGLLKY